jgi:hypothetical protein
MIECRQRAQVADAEPGTKAAKLLSVRHHRSLLALVVAGFVLASSGCAVSPQPSPPGSSLEVALVTPGLTPEAAFEGVVFRGAPGAVTPAVGVVVITNLDTSDAPSLAPVSADGSFEVAVSGSLSDVYRLQVKAGSQRSEPRDLRVDGTSFALAVPALDDCFFIDPTTWLALDGAGDARSLVLENACAEPVGFLAPRLRRGLAGFGLTPTSSFVLAPGASTTITIRSNGPGSESEDVLLLEADLTTRAITLTLPD